MHTATIVTTVQLIDAMSPALGVIQNAQALVAQGFLKIRDAADRAFDTSAAAAFQAKLDGIAASLERVAQQADLSAAESSYERLAALAGELERRLNRIGGQSGGSGGDSDGDSDGGSGGDSGGDSGGGSGGGSGEGGQDGAAKQWDTLKKNAEKIGGIIKKTTELADQTARTNAYIAQMNDGLQTADQLQGMLFTAAQNSATAYSEVVKTAGALSASAGGAFSSNQEAVVFTELMNKQFVAGGTDQQDQAAVMGKLTNAMGAGVIKADMFSELEARIPQIGTLLSNAFGIGQAELDKLVASGGLTAELFKNAMLASSDEINAQFGGTPITWARVWTAATDELLMALQPVLGAISGLAQHAEILIPVIFGVVAAFQAYTILSSIMEAKSWLASGAFKDLFAALKSNPILMIATAIGIVITLIYAWIQSVGGIQVAWLMVKNVLLSVWGVIKIAFFTGVFWVMNLMDKMALKWLTMAVNLQNTAGDMKANILMILQGMINGAIDIINKFIGALNKIPGVSIDTIQHVTFGTEEMLKNEAEKQKRNELLNAAAEEAENRRAERERTLDKMKAEELINAAKRQSEIEAARNQANANAQANSYLPSGIDLKGQGGNGANGSGNGPGDLEDPYGEVLETIADNTAASADSLDLNNEELEWMRDLAEQEAINRFTTTEIRVDMGGVTQNVASYLDAETLTHRMVEAINSGTAMGVEGVYA
ncbi:tape measure protein [Anaerotruncus colihominis]|uniref:Tape measure protein n=1 Tax=Anaerotruncus colihominis TaxID=169435 RepID=A0A845T0R1_9FIRM|nr:tape measure protein [Anaerotruncus colihominis]MCR2025246.1 tape measure protein [Anaerotruncus colihominis]NDO40454.1 tape measure protein [Anaerotruncus colihominis]